MISILITTYNSAKFLERCIESVRAQTHHPVELIIVDNASTDGTRGILAKFESEATIIYNDENTGFAAGQNAAARRATGDWLLSLNPDVVLDADFIGEAVASAEGHPEVGAVCGKLLRWKPGTVPEFSQIIDSTGICFLPNLRHLDRGSEELDQGQFEVPGYVFGATGAAALYRNKMLQDVAVEGEFFDEQFFAYREDADLAWRAQLLGWLCLYTPRAVAWHVRRVTPERRNQLPLPINWHSIKNRFLMRAKNISLPLYCRLFFPVTIRDVQVIGYCLLVDRRLASALVAVWRLRHDVKRKRLEIQSRRRVLDKHLRHWFSVGPV